MSVLTTSIQVTRNFTRQISQLRASVQVSERQRCILIVGLDKSIYQIYSLILTVRQCKSLLKTLMKALEGTIKFPLHDLRIVLTTGQLRAPEECCLGRATNQAKQSGSLTFLPPSQKGKG